MTKHYFIKEKCKNWSNPFNPYNLKILEKCDEYCIYCKGKDFVKGSDITEYITGVLKEIDKFKVIACIHTEEIKQIIFKDLIVEEDWFP
jgi:hypothetical protein